MDIERIMTVNGLTNKEREEFSEYTANRFNRFEEIEEPDVSFLDTWRGILAYSEQVGTAKAINDKVCPTRPVEFRSPDEVRLELYSSFAGLIPIIYVRDTADFEQLVTNAAYKGVRPANISQTGASFLHGKSNRFIILSQKPYSNVPAAELGLDDDEWAEKSMLLRRGHECTHYFTKQKYGIANNIVHDEVIADFIGMYEAFGFYKAEWFLRFMGIIAGSGGRLVFCTEDLSPNVRRAVSDMLTTVAYRLEEWSGTKTFRGLTVCERIKLLCRKGLQYMMTSI